MKGSLLRRIVSMPASRCIHRNFLCSNRAAQHPIQIFALRDLDLEGDESMRKICCKRNESILVIDNVDVCLLIDRISNFATAESPRQKIKIVPRSCLRELNLYQEKEKRFVLRMYQVSMKIHRTTRVSDEFHSCCTGLRRKNFLFTR
jgi:hypothetical protein